VDGRETDRFSDGPRRLGGTADDPGRGHRVGRSQIAGQIRSRSSVDPPVDQMTIKREQGSENREHGVEQPPERPPCQSLRKCPLILRGWRLQIAHEPDRGRLIPVVVGHICFSRAIAALELLQSLAQMKLKPNHRWSFVTRTSCRCEPKRRCRRDTLLHHDPPLGRRAAMQLGCKNANPCRTSPEARKITGRHRSVLRNLVATKKVMGGQRAFAGYRQSSRVPWPSTRPSIDGFARQRAAD